MIVQCIRITPISVIYSRNAAILACAACKIIHTNILYVHRNSHTQPPLLSHSVTILEEWHHSIMGIFQCYQLSDER